VRIIRFGIASRFLIARLVSLAAALCAIQASTLRIVNESKTLRELARVGAERRSARTGDVAASVEKACSGPAARLSPRLAARLLRHGCNIVAITFRRDERAMPDIDGSVAHLARDRAVPEAA
jgi:hypothetical protein